MNGVHNVTSMHNPLSGLIRQVKIWGMILLAGFACMWIYNHRQMPVATGSSLHCGTDQFKAIVPTDPSMSRDLAKIYAVSPAVDKVPLGKVAKLNGLEPTSTVSGNALGEVCIFFTGKGVTASNAAEGATSGN